MEFKRNNRYYFRMFITICVLLHMFYMNLLNESSQYISWLICSIILILEVWFRRHRKLSNSCLYYVIKGRNKIKTRNVRVWTWKLFSLNLLWRHLRITCPVCIVIGQNYELEQHSLLGGLCKFYFYHSFIRFIWLIFNIYLYKNISMY